MLKINLLPNEYKQAEKTPAGSYLIVAACTFLAVSSVCCVAFLYFGVLKSAETMRDIAKEQYENLLPMAKYADDLDAEKKEYIKRSEVIKDIERTRILWTKKIDQLMEVINNQGDTKRHWVWLKDLKVRMTGTRDPGLELKGFEVGDQYEQLSSFNEDLKNHDLFKDDFYAISNPTGAITLNDDMIPCSAIEFSWTLKLKDKSAEKGPTPAKNTAQKSAQNSKKM
jgi:Tfp pilus assembly protein PilN